MKTFLISIIAYISIATTGVAEVGDIYNCKFGVSRFDWLSEQVIFGVADENKKVTVYDAIIHQEYGEPIDAEVYRDDEKRFSIRWLVVTPDAHGRTSKLSFKLTYFKQNKKATMRMIIPGAENRYSSRGKCSIAKGNI